MSSYLLTVDSVFFVCVDYQTCSCHGQRLTALLCACSMCSARCCCTLRRCALRHALVDLMYLNMATKRCLCSVLATVLCTCSLTWLAKQQQRCTAIWRCFAVHWLQEDTGVQWKERKDHREFCWLGAFAPSKVCAVLPYASLLLLYTYRCVCI
jgi:hypothetical protein